MRLYQRADVWYVEFTDERKRRHRLSTEESDEGKAKVRALEIMRAHLIDSLPDEARRSLTTAITLTYALEKAWDKVWRGQAQAKSIRYRINQIEEAIGFWPIRQITFLKLEEYVERLRREEAAPATINRKLSAIRVAMTEAAKRGELDALPPFPYQDEQNTKDRFLTHDEEDAVLEWVDKRCAEVRSDKTEDWRYFRTLLPVLADTGLRLTEALTLTKEAIIERPGQPAFVLLRHSTREQRKTKSGKGRSVPLTPRALEFCKALLAHDAHGKRDANWAGRKARQVREALGLDDEVTLHVLRHTCASRLVQGGMDIYRVQKWLGHADITTTTKRYAHLTPENLLDGANILSRS